MKPAEQTIADLEIRLQKLNADAKKIKTTINCLLEVNGKPPKYDDIEESQEIKTGQRPDEYYGRPLATVVTEVLNKRESTGLGAATLDEIYNLLVAGGCKLIGKNDGIKKRGLAISMSKNQKFHKLPNDTWGLSKWYPDVKNKMNQAKEDNGIISDENNEEESPKENQ